MASTTSCLVLNPLPLRLGHYAPRSTCRPAIVSGPAHLRRCSSALTTRRGWLLMLMAVPWARQQPAMAQDIPLFGLRRKVEKAEEVAEEILKEGIETAEKGVETAESEIEAAEIGIETVVSFGGLAQAGAVAGAEAVGVLVATSVVNGILGPEGRKT